jgi:hypothetical protein
VAATLDLVNKALSLLGEGLLTPGQLSAPDDDTSRTVVAILETARKGLLRDCKPNCARKYAVLVEANPAPVNPDFLYAFDLPSDCLRAVRVLSTEIGSNVIEGIGAPLVTRWRILTGRYLLTDVGEAALEYVSDIATTAFDPLTDEAFAYYLAWQLALPLTESRVTAADMQEQYLIAQQRLMGTDENEGQVDRVDQATRLTSVRHR